jgi:cell division septation protein DedD
MSAVATLAQAQVTVDPGSQVQTTIRVRNAGSIVDRFDIDVVGVTGWVLVDPAALSLFPGAEGTATITFAPPRAPVPRAGAVPFGVRVRPAADPRGSTVEEGRVTVTPFSAVTADIAPQTSRGSRGSRHEVAVENQGNAPVEVVVTALDPDRRLVLAVDPQRAVIAPEQRAGFGVAVSVDDPFPFGPRRPRPFQVNVAPGRQAPIQLRATLSQGPLLPGWIPPVGGIAIAAVALAAVAFATGMGPFAPAATPTPSDVAQASISPSPAAGPSESPTAAVASPSPSATGTPPDVSPTPSPTPKPLKLGDFTLAVTGDSVGLGNGLALRCEPSDQACRDEAKDTIRTIVTELQNPYSGAGIPSTRSLQIANTLPIVLTAPRDFPWRQLGAGETGATQTAVIDLGPLLANPSTYVYAVVDTADSQETRRYVIDPAIAKQLFDMLYRLPTEMGPVVAATPPPNSSIRDQLFVDSINWNFNWVLGTPSP